MVDQGSSIWTEERKRVLNGLEELPDPILSQLYEKAINLASDYYPESSEAQFNLAIIGHCVRELMNNISYYLDGVSTSGRNRSGAEDRTAKELRELLVSEYPDIALTPSKNATQVPIPANLAVALSAYRSMAIEGRINSDESASMSAIGRIEEGNPAAALWRRTRDEFVSYAHLSRGRRGLPERSLLLHNLDILDNALTNRLGFFFEAKRKVSDILAHANHYENGAYTVPSKDELDAARALLGDPGIRFVFYSNLINPKWLIPLEREKAFERSIPQEADSAYDTSWPEAIYLRTVAEERPEDVTRIILNAGRKPLQTIRLAEIDLGFRLPLKHAIEISREVKSWAYGRYQPDGFFWMRDEVINLISRLMESYDNAARKAGKALFEACFMPYHDGRSLSGCKSLIPDWGYADRLSKLQRSIETLSLRARIAIFSSFSEALLSEKMPSTFLVPSIDNACEKHRDSMVKEVLYQIVKALLGALSDDPEMAIKSIKRIEEKVLAFRCALSSCRAFIEQCLSGQQVIPQSLDAYLHDMLLSNLILNEEYEAELYPLYTLCVRCGVITSSELVGKVYSLREAITEEYSTRLEALNMAGQEDPSRYARRWQHRVLTLIGCDMLDDEGLSWYKKLGEEFPNSQYILNEGCETQTITGPNSPLSDEELSQMPPEELISFLEAWHPTDEDCNRLISHLGLGRHLSRRLADSPFLLQGMMERLYGLRPIYQAMVLNGWGEALKNGSSVPVNDALSLLGFASRRSEDDSWPPEGNSFDDDGNYLHFRREAAEMAVRLLDSSVCLTNEQVNSLLDSIVRLSKSNDPGEEFEGKYGGDNSDPFTMSLNAIRPIAIRALAKWIKKNSLNGRIAEALNHLEAFLPDRSSSDTDAATIGEALPWLVEADAAWATNHRAAIFGEGEANRRQQIALTTVLSLYILSPQMLSFCSPAIFQALDNQARPYALGFRFDGSDCVTLIGEKLYGAYAIGQIDWDDELLARLWEKMDEAQAGAILGKICGAVRDGSGVTDAIASRIGKLWDYHANSLLKSKGPKSLKGITRLLKSGCYPISWWGPRLLKELEVNPDDINLMLFEDEFIALSEEDPELAMEILRQVIEHDQYPIAPYYEEFGILVLSKLRASNNGVLPADAVRFMDLLGRIGCLDVDDKLK